MAEKEQKKATGKKSTNAHEHYSENEQYPWHIRLGEHLHPHKIMSRITYAWMWSLQQLGDDSFHIWFNQFNTLNLSPAFYSLSLSLCFLSSTLCLSLLSIFHTYSLTQSVSQWLLSTSLPCLSCLYQVTHSLLICVSDYILNGRRNDAKKRRLTCVSLHHNTYIQYTVYLTRCLFFGEWKANKYENKRKFLAFLYFFFNFFVWMELAA